MLSVKSICLLLVFLRAYYIFTPDFNAIQDTDATTKQTLTPCDIAKSYIYNESVCLIQPSVNVSIVYPLLSCGIPHKTISIFNNISPYQITNDYILSRLYSLGVSLFIQLLFIRICNLLLLYNVDCCRLLYCSSMITLSLTTHNITLYPLQLNLLIIFIWFILESRKYCESYQSNLSLLFRNFICGIIVTISSWTNALFIIYSYPYILYLFIDNALIFKLKSKANAQKSVIKTTMYLSIWSTCFGFGIVVASIYLILMDAKYFGKPKLVPFDQMDAFWNINHNNNDEYALYEHLLFNIQYLYCFLFIYLIYFIFYYKLKGLEVALFYSKEIAIILSSQIGSTAYKEMNKKFKSPFYVVAFYYAMLLHLFSTICILSLITYQPYQLLIPLFIPMIILGSAVFHPFLEVNYPSDIKLNTPKSDVDKVKEILSAFKGKDIHGKNLKTEHKIHFILLCVWYGYNLLITQYELIP